MKNPIPLTSILVCLMGGQLFCPIFARATVTSDTIIHSQNQSNQSKNDESGIKQNFPQCTHNCNNSGKEGGGGN